MKLFERERGRDMVALCELHIGKTVLAGVRYTVFCEGGGRMRRSVAVGCSRRVAHTPCMQHMTYEFVGGYGYYLY
jgi:hypothetical protein